ncbi:soluble calcium-activated nucleotidase 1 [Neocloeon triangulifer]|uniref:soluble calcium-activated nucleotidase 1 n=1 Tax=Neocloeon triangulifer TaxID=2078957 RepID=UPI00286FA78E|nr:soluble calcium-activated nucleotidase 1 [Neocloeon triangulifer]
MVDWRQAIRTPPAYRVGSSTLRLQMRFVAVVVAVGAFLLLLLYFATANRGHLRPAVVLPPPSPSPQDAVAPNLSYPLTKPLVGRGQVTYVIGMIADLDTAAAEPDGRSWKSLFWRGRLTWTPSSKGVSVTWDASPIEIKGQLAAGGRGMELSELVTFTGRLLTADDRTGVIYQLLEYGGQKPRVVPWVLLGDGDGHAAKGFKSEWATVANGRLLVGGLGKEWTTSKGELVNYDPMWVKRVAPDGGVEHLDWSKHYEKIRQACGITFPGYLIHEAVNWSERHKKWFFLPRRASKERYDEARDERMGTNLLITADATFQEVKVTEVGPLVPSHGFSSFKFLPGTDDEVIVALKSEEDQGKSATFLTVFTVKGEVLYPETKVADNKFEGIEFI